MYILSKLLSKLVVSSYQPRKIYHKNTIHTNCNFSLCVFFLFYDTSKSNGYCHANLCKYVPFNMIYRLLARQGNGTNLRAMAPTTLTTYIYCRLQTPPQKTDSIIILGAMHLNSG